MTTQRATPPLTGPPRPGPPAAERDGDLDLLDGLYRAHALALVRTAKLLLRDQPSAEDVVQDAFLNVYRALPRLRERDEILSYLRAAVINGSRSLLRKRVHSRGNALRDAPALAGV